MDKPRAVRLSAHVEVEIRNKCSKLYELFRISGLSGLGDL